MWPSQLGPNSVAYSSRTSATRSATGTGGFKSSSLCPTEV
jgi:hypothetical protein